MNDEFTIATIEPGIVTPMIHGITWKILTES
jgi:hypothetical protein